METGRINNTNDFALPRSGGVESHEEKDPCDSYTRSEQVEKKSIPRTMKSIAGSEAQGNIGDTVEIGAGAKRGINLSTISIKEAENLLDKSAKVGPLWTFNTDDWIRTDPCVGPDGTVYTGNDGGHIYALKDGDLKWQFTIDKEDSVPSSPVPGADGIVYFGSNGHKVYAVRDGRKLWDTQLEKDITMMTPPRLDSNGVVYAAILGNGTIYAIKDGKSLWEHKPEKGLSSFLSVSPDGTVYGGSNDGSLFALRDGKKLWDIQLKDRIEAAPCIGADGTIYAGGKSGKIYAIRNGKKIWSIDSGMELSSSPLAGPDGVVYFGASKGETNYLCAVKKGKRLWSFEANKKGFSGVVYSTPCMSPEGILFIGSKDGNLYAVKDGNRVWELRTGNVIYGSPAIDGNGTVFIGSTDGSLYAVNPIESLREKAGSITTDDDSEAIVEMDNGWVIIGGVKLPVNREGGLSCQ